MLSCNSLENKNKFSKNPTKSRSLASGYGTRDANTMDAANDEFQNNDAINSPKQGQGASPDGDIDHRIYCERLRYEELRLVHQAKDIRDKILDDPLTRRIRKPLFEQHDQVRTQLRSTQVAMSTECSLAPSFF